MPISPARAAAFEILLRVETTEAYASELLHSARFVKLSPADHRLLTELVMGSLRWRAFLDQQIEKHSSQPLGKLDREVIAALRLGAYQLLLLDRIPGHAAINESVELVKRARKRSAAGMVNAVLRKISRARSDFSHPSKTAKGGAPSEIESSHPRWMVERWEQLYGLEASRKICEYDQSPPQPVIRSFMDSPKDSDCSGSSSDPRVPHSSRFSKGGNFPSLTDDVQLAPGKLLARAAVVTAGDITRTQPFRERRLVIQDEASQLVALLVGKGKRILDCCAAPGGKTRILAQRNPEAQIIAMELHPHRAQLLRRLLPEGNIQVIAADARQTPLAAEFDRILVDAPCSGTGTLARNPEIKWRLKPADLARLEEYQSQILQSAMQRVASGGRIVYSTCSLEPEENSEVIERALAANGSFRLLDCRHVLEELRHEEELAWHDIPSVLSGPFLRTIPGVHPCDGFFAAILEKI